MSLIGYFLQKENQSPANIKYLHSLLSLPVMKLRKEKDHLSHQIDSLENQIRASALNESKLFINALGDTSSLLSLQSSLSSSLSACCSEALAVKQKVSEHSENITRILNEQQKLDSLSSMQSIVSEILEIPQLLKNLVNSRHYNEALKLLKFIENIEVDAGVFKEIQECGNVMKKRMDEDFIEILCESLDGKKIRETVDWLASVRKMAEEQKVEVFFRCKMISFEKIVKKTMIPKSNLLGFGEMILEFLVMIDAIFRELFVGSEGSLVLFYVEVVSRVFGVLRANHPQTITELYEVSQRIAKVNEKIFAPIGCNVWPEFYEFMLQVFKEQLQGYTKKTITNFENLIKLYGWESSGNKENVLLEFGSMAVLYNNVLAIVNEVRSMPLEEMKESFFLSIQEVLRRCSEIIIEKARNLMGNESLTKQQMVIRGLMNKYIECARSVAYPELIRSALGTYEDSEGFREGLNSTLTCFNL